MHETNITEQLLTPEAEAIDQLSAQADRAFEQYGAQPVPEDMIPDGFEGTMEQTTGPNGHLLTRTTLPDGRAGYEFSALWHSSADRGALMRYWEREGVTMTTQERSEVHGDAPEQETDAEGIAQAQSEFGYAFPDKPVEPPSRFERRATRPAGYAGRHRRPKGATEAELGEAYESTAEPQRDPWEANGVQQRREEARSDAERARHNIERYAHNMALTEQQIDGLAQDPTVKWEWVDRKNPAAGRTTTLMLPSGDEGGFVMAKVSVVDEAHRPRWYVLHVNRVQKHHVGTPERLFYWPRGEARPYTYSSTERKPVPRYASANHMALLAQATDPARARPRRTKEYQESIEPHVSTTELPLKNKVAHYLGRLIGQKNITRW